MRPLGETAARLAARLASGGVLAVSGFFKAVRPPEEFAAAIASYQLVPPAWTLWIASAFPYVELLTGTFLAAGLFTVWAARAAAACYAGFIFFLGSALWRGIDLVSCGCFGPTVSISPRFTLALDVLSLGLSGWIAAGGAGRASLDGWFEGRGGSD